VIFDGMIQPASGMATGPVHSPIHVLRFSIVLHFIHSHSSRAEGSIAVFRALERRVSVRHETVNNRMSVQLLEWTEPRFREARLVNFSSTGALLLTDQVPKLHRPLRVRLKNAKEIGWHSAVPVRLGRSNEVGLKFARPVPLEFFSNSMAARHPMMGADIDDETRYPGEDSTTSWGLPDEN
jgi:hypothetical protein